MIEIRETQGHLLVAALRGKITHADYRDVLVPAIDRVREHERSIDFLALLEPDFEGYELQALIDDARLGVRTWSAWRKIALVGGPPWLRHAAGLFGLFLPGSVRSFDDEAAARAWLAE